jgi:raffinose/stachyose/melibiose transport system substrate-binding protein
MTASYTRREFVQRASASAVAMTSLGSLLAACGGDGAGGGDAEQELEGTITLWSDISDATAKKYFQDEIIAPFQRENSGLEVDVSFRRAEDMQPQIRLALQARNAPDLIPTNGPAFVPDLAEAGFLADLGSYADERNWDEVMLPWALDLGQVGDTLVALPTQLETLGIYINRTLFDEHGWEVPTNRAELEALADEVAAAGILPFAAGSANFRQQIEWYTSVFFSNTAGPQLMYQVLTGDKPWTSPGMVEAITLMQDYFQRGYFGGSVEKFFATAEDAVNAQLGNGEAAMQLSGTWHFQNIGNFFGSTANNENDWDFAAFPSLSDDAPYPTYPLGTGGTLSINEGSTLKAGAAAFLGYLIEDRARTAQWLAARGGAFSFPLRWTAEDFPASMDSRQRATYVSLVEASEQGNFGYTNWSFSPPKTAVYIYEEVEAVVTGDTAPEEFLEGVAVTFQEDLDDGFTPKVPNPSA